MQAEVSPMLQAAAQSAEPHAKPKAATGIAVVVVAAVVVIEIGSRAKCIPPHALAVATKHKCPSSPVETSPSIVPIVTNPRDPVALTTVALVVVLVIAAHAGKRVYE